MTLSKRVTIAHTHHRSFAQMLADAERSRYPDAHVTVSGEQGKWKVRRDRLSSDPEQVVVRTQGIWES